VGLRVSDNTKIMLLLVALYAALTLEPAERRRRAEAIREQVRTHDIRAWVEAQLADLDAVRSS